MTAAETLRDRTATPAARYHALCAVATPERLAMLPPYPAFLQTGYWRIITAYIRATRHKCNRCGTTRELQVHHRTYQHHRREHEHLEDLELLCRECHARHHHIPVVTSGVRATDWRSVGELIPAALAYIASQVGVDA